LNKDGKLEYPKIEVNGQRFFSIDEGNARAEALEMESQRFSTSTFLVNSIVFTAPAFEINLSTMTDWGSKSDFERAMTNEGLIELAEKLLTRKAVLESIEPGSVDALDYKARLDWVISEIKKRK
jgi:hypothetical protein